MGAWKRQGPTMEEAGTIVQVDGDLRVSETQCTAK